jgi:hypothetical protein
MLVGSLVLLGECDGSQQLGNVDREGALTIGQEEASALSMRCPASRTSLTTSSMSRRQRKMKQRRAINRTVKLTGDSGQMNLSRAEGPAARGVMQMAIRRLETQDSGSMDNMSFNS